MGTALDSSLQMHDQQIPPPFAHEGDVLNRRDMEILQLISLGKRNKEIADALDTSVSMVKWRTNQLFTKLHVRNRLQAVTRAQQLLPTASLTCALPPAGPMPETLTKAERKILQLLEFGLTNQRIARSLGLTTGTVRWHFGVIFDKLQVRGRVQALARARQHNWL